MWYPGLEKKGQPLEERPQHDSSVLRGRGDLVLPGEKGRDLWGRRWWGPFYEGHFRETSDRGVTIVYTEKGRCGSLLVEKKVETGVDLP